MQAADHAAGQCPADQNPEAEHALILENLSALAPGQSDLAADQTQPLADAN
jgi:hypothetical protein